MTNSKHCMGPNIYEEVPDGGWGWAIAMAFFLVEVCTYGIIKSLGVFLQDLMEEFGESNSRVSWVISICVFIFTFTAPLSTILSNRFGYRPVVMMGGLLISLGTITSAFTNSINEMYITVGIISGLGYCLTFLPTVTILAQYFSRRRAFVTAIASSGESFAVFVFAPAFSTLKQHIGWRYCLVILGTFQASVIGCGLLLRPVIIKPQQLQTVYKIENEQTRTSISSGVSQHSEDSGVTSISGSDVDLGEAGPHKSCSPRLLDFSVLTDAAFIWYSLFGLFATLGFFAPQLYIIELSKSRGVDSSMASYMLSVMAVAEICGRLSIGIILNKVCCRKTLVLLGCVVLLCLVLGVFTIVWEFWGLVICCALYGYFLGTVCSIHIPMLAEEDVVGIQKMASCVGVYVFIQSLAGLAGPPLGGVLVDITQDYGAAFYSSVVGMGLSAICLALVGPAKSGLCKRHSRDEEKHKISEKEGKPSQSSDQTDFLEVDLAPEDSPIRSSLNQGASVI
uniref:Monocarboxylate transporter 7 n=1 Tax=Echeneis naucrates TaxID=173247 RepID=A0A665TZT0_ECHNA